MREIIITNGTMYSAGSAANASPLGVRCSQGNESQPQVEEDTGAAPLT